MYVKGHDLQKLKVVLYTNGTFNLVNSPYGLNSIRCSILKIHFYTTLSKFPFKSSLLRTCFSSDSFIRFQLPLKVKWFQAVKFDNLINRLY